VTVHIIGFLSFSVVFYSCVHLMELKTNVSNVAKTNFSDFPCF